MLIPSHGLDWRAVIVGAAYLFFLFGHTATPNEDLCKDVARAVLDALNSARIDPKDAASLMLLSQARFYQQMQGDTANPIALWRLMLLPLNFWLYFNGWLAMRIMQRHYAHAMDAIQKLTVRG